MLENFLKFDTPKIYISQNRFGNFSAKVVKTIGGSRVIKVSWSYMKVLFDTVLTLQTALQNNRRFSRYGLLKLARFRLLLGNLGFKMGQFLVFFVSYFHQNYVNDAEIH